MKAQPWRSINENVTGTKVKADVKPATRADLADKQPGREQNLLRLGQGQKGGTKGSPMATQGTLSFLWNKLTFLCCCVIY